MFIIAIVMEFYSASQKKRHGNIDLRNVAREEENP